MTTVSSVVCFAIGAVLGVLVRKTWRAVSWPVRRALDHAHSAGSRHTVVILGTLAGTFMTMPVLWLLTGWGLGALILTELVLAGLVAVTPALVGE